MSSLIFLSSWLSNTFFVFLTSVLMVHGVLALSKLRNYRARASIRLIPGIAVIITSVFHQFNIGRFFNLLHCDGWLQKTVVHFFPKLQSNLTNLKETLFGYFTLEPVALVINVILVAFVLITASIFFANVFHNYLVSKHLKEIIKNAEEYSKNLINPALAIQLEKHQVQVFISSFIQIPIAVGSRTIVLSKVSLELLRHEEIESVIAHEFAHLKSKDAWVRLWSQLFRALFWWIPMKQWMKRIEEDQEIACDQEAKKYHCSQKGIASALIKMAEVSLKQEKELATAFCKLTCKKHFLFTRLGLLLDKDQFRENKFWQGAVMFVAGFLIFLSCVI